MSDTNAALLEDILSDPNRRSIPGASQVVSFREDDESEYLAQLEDLAITRVGLERRGAWHGRVAELDPERVAAVKLPRPSHVRLRWREGRPFVLRRLFSDRLREWSNELHLADRWGADLREPEGLGRMLAMQLGGRGARFTPGPPHETLSDPERDVAKRSLIDSENDAAALWAKSGRLSTYPEDQSVRLRLGAGQEGADDAASDAVSHKALRAAGRACLPLLGAIDKDRDLWKRLSQYAETKLQPSHAIAYWNRPGGGARFHHDAFADEGDVQRGVLYTQLAGRTVWLSLSIADLAQQWMEFAEATLEGESPWLSEALQTAGVWERSGELFKAGTLAVLRELGEPGGGALGPWIDRGPEFTATLVDSGHAAVLHPGDCIVLPNNGRLSTAMHSVFCGGPGPNYAISTGLFPAG